MRLGSRVLLIHLGAVLAAACGKGSGPIGEAFMREVPAETTVAIQPDSVHSPFRQRIRAPVVRSLQPDPRLVPRVDDWQRSLFSEPDPTVVRTVTLAPFTTSPARNGWKPPAMTLLGGGADAWRLQLGPRMETGRGAGLTLHGGTQGPYDHWEMGASATAGARSNVQGTIRFHP